MLIGMCSPIAIHHYAPLFGIRQIGMRTENGGAMIADGYARVSGKVGVVGAMGGPGAALLVPGLAEAMHASTPIVALVEDCAVVDTDKNADEDLDPFKLFASCAKWIRRLNRNDRVDDYVDMAFRVATSGRPGPAVLCIPRDLEFEAAKPGRARSANMGRIPLHRSLADPACIAEAADRLAAAKRPLVVAGGGVHLSRAHDSLARLQDDIGLPVATTSQGKGSVDERHPLSLGVAGNALGRHGPAFQHRQLIDEADVILLVGNRTNERGTASWTMVPPAADVIHIDIDPQEIGRNYEALGLVGDAKLTLEALRAALVERDLTGLRSARSALEAQIRTGRGAFARLADPLLTSNARPILPQRLMAEIDQVLTSESVVVSDASFATLWMVSYLTSLRPGMRFLSPRGLGGLGWGLPAALGAKVAAGNAPVFAICGDGGFGHMWSELETAVRLGIRVILLVLNNQMLGYQVVVEDKLFDGNHSPGADFARVDHALLARAVGCRGVRIEDPNTIGAELRRAMTLDEPTLLDVIVDPSAIPPAIGLDD